MSRIGKQPVTVPAGVDVKIDGHIVTVKGPKGELTREFNPMMTISQEGEEIIVSRPDDSREARSLHGLTRTLIHNMVEGVSNGYQKKLQLVGVGYRAALKGKDLEMQLGFSHPVLMGALRTSRSRFPARPRSSSPASARSRSARWPLTSAHGASLSLTRARASAMRASMSAARSARLARTKRASVTERRDYHE